MNRAISLRYFHAAEEPDRVNLLLWGLLAAMNLIDLLATRSAFDFGIAELNPVVAQLHTAYGMSGIALCKAALLGLLLVLLPHIRGWLRVLFAAACLIYLVLTGIHVWYLAPLL